MRQQNDNLSDRLVFIGFDEQARAALRGLQPLLRAAMGPALEKFYKQLLATPDTRRFIKDESLIPHLKKKQADHWEIIASATFDETYLRGVRAIGHGHARLGMEPRWFVDGYAVIAGHLVEAVVARFFSRLFRRRAQRAAAAVSSIVKALMVDINLATTAYYEPAEAEHRRLEAERETSRQQQETVLKLVSEALGRLAAGDLTARMDGDLAPAFAGLKSDFNDAIEKLERALLSVSANAQAIHVGTQEMAMAVDDLSRRTEQQAASLEQTAAALDQVTATVKRSAEGAAHAAEAVTAATADAQGGTMVVRDATSAMSEQQFSMRLSRVCAGMVCRVGGDVAAPTPHRPGRADLPSRPGEFHPEPLTDPDMNLSIHPARAIHRRLPPSVEIGGLLRSPVGPSLQRGWPPPFAPWALPHFSTTTEESAPAWPVGISASRISRLCLFPWHRQTGSQVPCKSLDKIHAFYTPDTAWPVCRSPPRSSRGMRAPPVLMSPKAFRCVCEGSLALVSLIHTWRDHCHAFSTTLTTAAFG